MKIKSTINKIKKLVKELENQMETDSDCGCLFEVINKKPVLIVVTPNGQSIREDFTRAVDFIGDNGGVDWSDDDIKEMEVWQLAFQKAATFLQTKAAEITQQQKTQ